MCEPILVLGARARYHAVTTASQCTVRVQGSSIFNDITVPKRPTHLVEAAMGVGEADMKARDRLSRDTCGYIAV